MTLLDSKGMHDLRALLADPGRERHVLDLWAGAMSPGVGPADVASEGLRQEAGSQPVIDEVARNHGSRTH